MSRLWPVGESAQADYETLRSAVLAACYTASLRIAGELGARTVALPAVSAGAYGWPADDAARIAVAAVHGQPGPALDEARFVLFSDSMLAAFRAALESLPGQ